MLVPEGQQVWSEEGLDVEAGAVFLRMPEETSGHAQGHGMLMLLDIIVSNCTSELPLSSFLFLYCKDRLRGCLLISGEALGGQAAASGCTLYPPLGQAKGSCFPPFYASL